MERRPIIIIGSGPAGCATALYLQREQPQLAGEVLVLEKAQHPRNKVCAGGLIPHTLDCLKALDVPLSVPHAVVHHGRVDVPGRRVERSDGEMCRVVRRDVFDQSLVQACRARGVEVRENEKVVHLARDTDGIRIDTEAATYHARVVIGADGSGSLVRRTLVSGGRDCVGKAVMCDVPVGESGWDGFASERYEFDFRAVPKGLRGYAWAFPCVIDGVPHVNVGVYAMHAHGTGALLRRVLHRQLEPLGAKPYPVQSFPIRWYGHGVRVTAPHVLLAGDAAGAEALMGEGISFAFEWGRVAANAATAALASGQFEFAAIDAAVVASRLGKKLRRLEWAARLFYGPTWPLTLGVAAFSRRAQYVGVRWYNGVDGWDQRRGRDVLRACLLGPLET